MIGCKLANTPIDPNHKVGYDHDGSLVDKGRYLRLVEKLIYLLHIRLDIVYAVSVVSQFMHSPRECHMDVAQGILSTRHM